MAKARKSRSESRKSKGMTAEPKTADELRNAHDHGIAGKGDVESESS